MAGLGIVSDGERVLLGEEEGGDEPLVLAGNLPGVAVLVGKDRFRTGSYAINNLGASAVILDDGYQHIALRRDFDIVTLDSSCPFGNGHLLPRGTLREPVGGLRRADLFLLTRVDTAASTGSCVEDLRRKLRSVNPAAPVLESVHLPVCLENVVTGERLELEFLTGRNVFAVSSIGNPQSFEKTLRNLGARLVDEFRFADHHRYTFDEIAKIRRMAQERGVRTWLTTQKDAVRLKPFRNSFVTGGAIDVLALVIELKIVRGEEILEDMVKALFEKTPRQSCND
jgi:tetraacyldisaccharide 4'-kinase